jgi:hypothetical protein
MARRKDEYELIGSVLGTETYKNKRTDKKYHTYTTRTGTMRLKKVGEL